MSRIFFFFLTFLNIPDEVADFYLGFDQTCEFGILSRSFLCCFECLKPFLTFMAGQICSTPPSQADLLSHSHQFLCGLIKLIRTCASFQGSQALGVVEGAEASSQDLSTQQQGREDKSRPARWAFLRGLSAAPERLQPVSTYASIILIRLAAQLTGKTRAKQNCKMADIWGNKNSKFEVSNAIRGNDFKLFLFNKLLIDSFLRCCY